MEAEMVMEEVDALAEAIADSAAGGRLRLAHLTGSHLYGLSTPDSDIDVRGVHVADPRGLLAVSPAFTPNRRTSQVNLSGADVSSMEVGKVFHLLLGCNTAVLELLYMPTWAWLKTDRRLQEGLMGLQDAFLSKHVTNAYPGYMWSNVNQVLNHVVRALVRHDDVYEDLLPTGGRSVDAWLKRADHEEKMDRLDSLDHDVDWSVASETRAYKAAMHSVRLLVSFNYFLDHGEFLVDCTSQPGLVEELMGLRRGEWTFSEFTHRVRSEYSVAKEKMATGALDHLPDEPDRERVNEWLVNYRLSILRSP